MKTLVMGLGNDIIADDAVGILAARELREKIDQDGEIEIVETSMHGLALLDFFIGYDSAVLIDAIQSGKHPVGTVMEIDPAALTAVYAPSPHYAGLPEMLKVAEELELDFPDKFRIIAVEIQDALTIGGQMTGAVREAIPEICERVLKAISEIRA